MMKSGDICLEFRLAKDKKEQIRILADKNLTSKESIALILFDSGEIQKTREKEVLLDVLDSLESHISYTEKKLEKLCSKYKSIADFVKGASI